MEHFISDMNDVHLGFVLMIMKLLKVCFSKCLGVKTLMC